MSKATTIIKDQDVFTLIRGEFNAEDALEIVTHVIRKKIRFHEMRNLSEQIRYGAGDEASLKRIGELNESLEAFRKLAEEAKATGRPIKLESSIKADLV